MTSPARGIGGDIRPASRRGVVPLPPDMPARRHVSGITGPRIAAQPQLTSASAPAPAASPRPTARTRHRPRASWQAAWRLGQYPLIAAVALGAAASSTFGQAMVAVYGLVVIFTRQNSQVTFGLALVILISVPLFQALGQPGIAGVAAIYVFELLVVGTIQAILELKQTA